MSDSETVDESPEFEYTTRIEDGHTIIDVTGNHEVTFVIQSASGERIYFPPEDMSNKSKDEQDSPYQSADSPYQSADSPYQSADSPYQSADSPYQPSDDPEVSTRGVSETRTGFRINHPEPASEIILFRESAVPA
jgi:hypothetical protein